MPKSIFDQVNDIGKRGWDMKGLTFLDKKCLVEDFEDDQMFNPDGQKDRAIHPDIKAEMP